MIVEAAQIVMRWNLFEYGNLYFQQLIGIAIQTPTALMWAITTTTGDIKRMYSFQNMELKCH